MAGCALLVSAAVRESRIEDEVCVDLGKRIGEINAGHLSLDVSARLSTISILLGNCIVAESVVGRGWM